MPIHANFALARYEDGLLVISMDPPVSITNWDLQFGVQKRFGGVDKITKSCAWQSGVVISSGVSIDDATNGIFSVNINSVDTSGWDQGVYSYEALRMNSGNRTVLTEGYLLLNY